MIYLGIYLKQMINMSKQLPWLESYLADFYNQK